MAALRGVCFSRCQIFPKAWSSQRFGAVGTGRSRRFMRKLEFPAPWRRPSPMSAPCLAFREISTYFLGHVCAFPLRGRSATRYVLRSIRGLTLFISIMKHCSTWRAGYAVTRRCLSPCISEQILCRLSPPVGRRELLQTLSIMRSSLARTNNAPGRRLA